MEIVPLVGFELGIFCMEVQIQMSESVIHVNGTQILANLDFREVCKVSKSISYANFSTPKKPNNSMYDIQSGLIIGWVSILYIFAE